MDMKINFKNILEGAWNSVFIKEEIEKVANERLAICATCENRAKRSFPPFDYHCKLCGCNLEMKTRSLSESCPISKWKAEVSEEEDNKILDKIKSEDGKDN